MLEEAETWAALGCGCDELPMRRGLSPWDLPHLIALRRLIRKEAPTIVHAHATKAGLLARLAAPRGVRVVYSPHSFTFQEMTGWRRTAIKVMERFLARRTDRFVFVSNAERELARTELGVAATRTRVIPNGLPDDWADSLLPRERVRCGWWEVSEQKRVIVVPARLAVQKGHDWLFQALADLKPLPGQLQVRLLGDGPSRADLEDLAAQLGISRMVVFDGHVPAAGELLAGADLVVLPSRHEGLSYALLETLAAGVPLLLSDIPGNVPHADMRDVAQFVPLDDAPALARAIQDFLNEPTPWRERAKRGPDLVLEHWSLERQIAELIRCYREL
jgi:glycosyltransferase involved in cell wall biosynthesis